MRGGEICRAFFFCNSRLVSAKKLLAAAAQFCILFPSFLIFTIYGTTS